MSRGGDKLFRHSWHFVKEPADVWTQPNSHFCAAVYSVFTLFIITSLMLMYGHIKQKFDLRFHWMWQVPATCSLLFPVDSAAPLAFPFTLCIQSSKYVFKATIRAGTLRGGNSFSFDTFLYWSSVKACMTDSRDSPSPSSIQVWYWNECFFKSEIELPKLYSRCMRLGSSYDKYKRDTPPPIIKYTQNVFPNIFVETAGNKQKVAERLRLGLVNLSDMPTKDLLTSKIC